MEEIFKNDFVNFKSNVSNRLLHYGALIYLSFIDEENKVFFASAEGFNKTKIRLKMHENLEKDSSFMKGLFKIYPNFYNNEFNKAKNKYEEQQNYTNLTTLEKRETRADWPKMIKSMDEETALNYQQYEKLKGTPIRYGQIIQLMHYNSNKWLYYDLNHVSDYESDNLKVGLKDEYSEESTFRILPCFTYQQESQDFVYIVSTVDISRKIIGDPYLHASRSKEITKEIEGERIKYEKREMNVSTEKKSNWKIQIFSEYIDEKKGFLTVCDIIWINFSEKDLTLIVQKNHSDSSDKSNYFKFVSSEQSENFKRFVGNSNGMFIIESFDNKVGGLVKWDNEYKLRHLTTNYYLALGETPTWETEEMQTNEIKKTLKLVKDPKQASLFKFEYIYSTLSSKNTAILTQYLQKDSYFRLMTKNKNTEFWLRTEEVSSEAVLTKEQDESNLLIVPVFSTKKKEEEIYKLAKANQNEIKMTCFLISSLSTIKNTCEYLKPSFIESKEVRYQNKYKTFLIRIARLEKCLNNLHLFCHNKLLAYLFSDQIYGTINSFIQNILREQLFIELLIKLLITAFPRYENLVELYEYLQLENESFSPLKIHSENSPQMLKSKQLQHEEISRTLKEEFLVKKKKICSLIYKLLASICKKNSVNQSKASIFLPIFSMHANFIPGVFECMTSIIENYEEILLDLHKEIYMKSDETHPSKIFKTQVDNKYITFLESENENEIFEIKKEQEYKTTYDKIIEEMEKEENYAIKTRWDILKFFTFIIFKSENSKNSFKKKQNLLNFFNNCATLYENGVNVNQELIYKYFNIGISEKVYKDVLIKMESDMKYIYIYSNNKKWSLEKFFIENELENNSRKKDNFAKNENLMTENNDEEMKLLSKNTNMLQSELPILNTNSFVSNLSHENIGEFVCHQFEFYSVMCQSRNFTWKSFLEKYFKYEAFIENMDCSANSNLNFEIKSKLCKLLSKLFIDQEPRRIKILPELCKVVEIEIQSESPILGNKDNKIKIDKFIEENISNSERLLDENNIFLQEKDKKTNYSRYNSQMPSETGVLTENYVDIQKMKIKIKEVITFMSEEITKVLEHYSKIFQESEEFGYNFQKDKRNELEVYEKFVNTKTMNIFNQFTFEIIKLFKLILQFGEYNIVLKGNYDQQEFFMNIKNLLLIFEYDKTYPEARFLLDKRKKDFKEKKKINPTKLIGSFIGAVSKSKLLNFGDIFGDSNKKTAKRQKKKKAITDLVFEEISAPVLKQVLNKVTNDSKNEIEQSIKLEICEIANYYMDYKQDVLLSNIKLFFKNIILKKNRFEEFRKGDISEEFLSNEIFKKKIEKNIYLILPEILKTGTSLDTTDPLLIRPTDKKISKQIEYLDLNNMLNFEILPSLLTMFCLTQNLDLEKQLLKIMNKLYNQRKIFSNLVMNMLLLFDDINIKVFHMFKLKLKILARHIDESEKWIASLDNSKNLVILENCASIFEYVNSLLFANSYIDNNEEIISNTFEKIDPIRQDILKHLEAYKIAILLIKDSLYYLEQIKDIKYLEDLKKLFKICFEFLKNFVKDNTTNQNILSEHLLTLIGNKNFDVGQVELLCEIFRNNKKICLQHYYNVAKLILHFIDVNGRQARYLEFFKIIQKVNQDYLLINQKTVLQILLNPEIIQNVLYVTDAPMNFGGANKHIFDFDIYKNGDEPFLYHANLLEVLSMSVVGKEGMYANETKLRSQFSLKYIISILRYPDNLTTFKKEIDDNNNVLDALHKKKAFVKFDEDKVLSPLKNDTKKLTEGYTNIKPVLLNFLYFAYLESEKISEEFEKYSKEFLKFIEQETTRLEFLEDYIPIYEKFLFDSLLQVAIQYLNLFNKTHLQQEKVVDIENTQEYSIFQRFTTTLHKAINENDFKIISKSSKVRKNLLQLFQFFQEDIIFDDVPLETETNMLKGLNLINASKDEVWKELWRIFLNTFLNSEILKNEIDKENLVFAKAINKTNEIYLRESEPETLMADIVSINEIIRKFINYLQLCSDDESLNETVIFILKTLSNYVTIQDDIEYDEDAPKEERIDREDEEMMLRQIHEKIVKEISKVKKEDEFEEIEEKKNVYEFLKLEDEILCLLRFLQLFAEGHNLDLQNYLRFQNNNYHTYDLIQDIIELLYHYMGSTKRSDYFENMKQCFESLTEFIQEDEFKDSLVKKYYDMDNRSLNKSITKTITNIQLDGNWKKGMTAQLKYKCSITLISLLESRRDNDIVLRMKKSLSMEALQRNIADVYIQFKHLYKEEYSDKCFQHFNKNIEKDDDEECSFIIETGFNFYFLYNNFIELKQYDEDIKYHEKDPNSSILQFNIVKKIGQFSFNFIKAGIQSVIKAVKNLCKRIFRIKDKEFFDLEIELSKLEKERDFSFFQALEFFKKNSAHIEVLREDNNIEKAYFYIPPFCHALENDKETKKEFNEDAKRISVKAKVSSLLLKSKDLIKKIKHNNRINMYLKKVKVIALLANNIILFRDVAFLLAIAINIMVLFSYEYKHDDDDTENIIIGFGITINLLTIIIVIYLLAKKAPLLISKEWIGVKRDKCNIFAYIRRIAKTIYYLLSDFYILYYLIYGITAVIGLAISAFFFAFHLFDILVRNPVLLNVIKSVYKPKKSLALTFFLFLDGGIGGFLTTMRKDAATNKYVIRFLFDNIFFILLMIIIINILLGIIIDTFGTLREEHKEYEHDLANFCFICGYDRESLDKASVSKNGFQKHIDEDHNMWNYLFYIAYIKEKEKTEYTGIESYVAEQIDKKEIFWFPTFRALCMKENTQMLEKEQIIAFLDKINIQQNRLQKGLKDLKIQIEDLEDQLRKKRTRKPDRKKTEMNK